MVVSQELVEMIGKGIDTMHVQLESNLSLELTAEARGKIKAFRAILKMIEEIESRR